MLNFFVLPCCIVRLVWRCCISDKFILYRKKGQPEIFCSSVLNKEIFPASIKEAVKCPCFLFTQSLLTGQYNSLVFILMPQFSSSMSKRKVIINTFYFIERAQRGAFGVVCY